ncbi:glycosyl hydrolase family 18 protein [bacterium]|nr:glycosyl hydrolase family 18 protein [bacterium]
MIACAILTAMRCFLLLSILLAAASSVCAQNAPARLLVGYWHNWSSPNVLQLAAVPEAFDIINVSFATPTVANGASMQFAPFPTAYPTNQSFIQDVALLQAAGKKVLISIGGANDPVVVDSVADAQTFASSMLQLITTFGFDGIDIDLEGASFSLQAGDTDFRNPTTPRVVHFISGLQQLLTQLPSDFILSAAPETAMVQGGMSTYGGVWGLTCRCCMRSAPASIGCTCSTTIQAQCMAGMVRSIRRAPSTSTLRWRMH